MKHLKYLRYVLRHKWFVFVAACRLGIPWLGITHDWSKLRPSEWSPYAEFFYGKAAKAVRDGTGYYKPTNTGDVAFDYAWFLHQKRNKHHWQYWVFPSGYAEQIPVRIPHRYEREMLADWRGAGRAQRTSNVLLWWEANNHKMLLHPETRAWIEVQLSRGTKGERDEGE